VADTRKNQWVGKQSGMSVMSALISTEKLKGIFVDHIVIKGEEAKGKQPVVTFEAGVTY